MMEEKKCGDMMGNRCDMPEYRRTMPCREEGNEQKCSCSMGQMPSRKMPPRKMSSLKDNVQRMPECGCKMPQMPPERMPECGCKMPQMPPERMPECGCKMPQMPPERMPECGCEMPKRPSRKMTAYTQNRMNKFSQSVPMNSKSSCNVCNINENTRNTNNNFNKKQILKNIYELGFVLIETMLYLDTHPNDGQAIEYYNDVMNKYNEYAQKYAQNFGPLNAFDMTNENYWMWVATPMPWEVQE